METMASKELLRLPQRILTEDCWCCFLEVCANTQCSSVQLRPCAWLLREGVGT